MGWSEEYAAREERCRKGLFASVAEAEEHYYWLRSCFASCRESGCGISCKEWVSFRGAVEFLAAHGVVVPLEY